MSQGIRRYRGNQHIPLVEYLRVYAGQAGWAAWYQDTEIQRVETIDPQHYRLHLVDGSVTEVSFRDNVKVYRPIDQTEEAE